MNLRSWAEKLCGVQSPPGAAALHVKDTAAAFLAGLGTSEGRALARLYGASADVAAGAAAIARLSECDDIDLASCVTPGAVAIPVALALAEGKSDEKFLCAIAAGYAAGSSLGLAIGGTKALAHGVWPTLLAAPAMAAVTASRLSGHDAETLAHAIALALAGANARAGRPTGAPSGRWFLFAEAVARGMRAAQAAGKGFRADLAILSHPWLAAQAGHDGIDMSAFESLPPVSAAGFKPFPIARQGANAVEAFRRMLAKGVDPARIERIEVFVPAMNVALLSRPVAEGDRLSRLCNIGFQLAYAALAPGMLFDPERADRPDIPLMEFARRVSVAAASDLDAHLPERWAARVAIDCGGKRFEETVTAAPFDPDAPALEQLLTDKWRRLLSPGGARDFLSQPVPGLLWRQIEERVRMTAEREG